MECPVRYVNKEVNFEEKGANYSYNGGKQSIKQDINGSSLTCVFLYISQM